jgi:hypothetical protein
LVSGNELLSNEDGSFALPYINNLSGGDYPANVIDRMGGIAWWGSGSHFVTGGYAFSNQALFFNAFTSGRTLGESVYLSGNGQSGTVYGDPLYQPIAVKLFLEGLSTSNSLVDPIPKYSFTDASFDPTRKLYIHAFNGNENESNTHWKIERCVSDAVTCSQLQIWETVLTGTGAKRYFDVGAIQSLLRMDLTKDNQMAMRVKVWTQDESKSFYSVFNLSYHILKAPSEVTEYILLKSQTWVNGDFSIHAKLVFSTWPNNYVSRGIDTIQVKMVNGKKSELLSISVKGKNHSDYSVSQTFFDVDTGIAVFQIRPSIDFSEDLTVSVTTNCVTETTQVQIRPGDVDFSGSIDSADVNILIETLTWLTPDELSSPEIIRWADVNGDGVLDTKDIDFVQALIGFSLPSY